MQSGWSSEITGRYLILSKKIKIGLYVGRNLGKKNLVKIFPSRKYFYQVFFTQSWHPTIATSQGCKPGFFFRGQGETEAFEILSEARPRRGFPIFPRGRGEAETFHFAFEARPRPSCPRPRRFSRRHKLNTL